jgi:hypothetical protein
MLLFLVLCGIIGIGLEYDVYLKHCAYFTKLLKDYIKYNCIEKFTNMCRNRRERDKLSKTGLKQIKDALFKHQNDFPISDSIQITANINDPTYFTNLLAEYSGNHDWTSKDIGDVLYILSILKENEISRKFLRVQRCYTLLLDEYIYNLHDSMNRELIYKNLNEQNQKLFKCIMTDLAMTKGEEAKLAQ